jgi:hypothetical protein
MSSVKQYIENEMSVIEEDFHKTFYMMLGNAKVFSEMLPKFIKTIYGTKDQKAIKYATKIKATLQNFNFLAAEIEHHYKIEDNRAKEAYKAMHADIARIIGVTITTLAFERYDSFANLLIDFNQGNYAQVEEHIIDSILDYQENKTLEGFGIIERYASTLPVEQKEEMSKDMVKWRDLSNIARK